VAKIDKNNKNNGNIEAYETIRLCDKTQILMKLNNFVLLDSDL